MNKTQVIGSVLGAFIFLALAFNNCSKVDVADSAELPSNLSNQMQIPTENPEGSLPTLEEQNELLGSLPPSPENSEPIPVTELIQHPELFEIYACAGGGSDVMICHFPESSNPPNTICIGRSAVTTHFSHFREVSQPDGSLKKLSDYLGPCRAL